VDVAVGAAASMTAEVLAAVAVAVASAADLLLVKAIGSVKGTTFS
jgi:hypothetical protein